MTSPTDSGGSPLSVFELFVNDGDDSNDATTPVAGYTASALTATVVASTNSMTAGKIYKFRFRAKN
jgi:hypothetical protein